MSFWVLILYKEGVLELNASDEHSKEMEGRDWSRLEVTDRLGCKTFTTCIIAASGGLLFGYDLGISGGVISMDSFFKKFFPEVHEKQSSLKPSDDQSCNFNSHTLTLFTSSLYIAALISSVFASVITRTSGRRITMLAGGYLFAVGAIFNGFAQNVWMLIVGRLLLGFGIGCTNQSVPIYISEVAPYICRGGLHMFFQLSMAIGILIAYLLNYFVVDKIDGGWGWRLSLGLAIVPAIIVIMGASVLPETPISLIERGHNDIAKQQLIKLRGDVRGVSVTDVEQEFTRLVAASKESQTMKHPWKNIFKRKYRPQLVLAICIPMFQQLTGMNVIVFYAPVLLRTTIGLKLVIFLLIFIVIISTGTMIFLTDLFGRRKTFLMACFQMFTPQIVGIILLNLIIAAESEILIIHIVLYYYAVGLGFSWGPLGGLVPSEIFPLEVRSVGQSINVCVNMLFSFGVAQVFTPMFCRMKLELLIFFTCNVVGMYTFIYNYLPETSMVRIEYMIEVFKNHPSWRQYYHQVHHHGENRAGSRAPRKQN
ncbi:sugar transport protein 1-like isoform X2 [Euphorbia lathyris]|uniref:sugar transport protein 1-like isoform X2 n=1 Tax=Euphorbia lathyris TaxID=212925 RepID=UPI003313426F